MESKLTHDALLSWLDPHQNTTKHTIQHWCIDSSRHCTDVLADEVWSPSPCACSFAIVHGPTTWRSDQPILSPTWNTFCVSLSIWFQLERIYKTLGMVRTTVFREVHETDKNIATP